MFRKNWVVYATYRDRHSGEIVTISLAFWDLRKKEALKRTYDYLCFSKTGLQISFRNVYVVKPVAMTIQ